MKSRLGVFGGMFDPVHNGHLEAARFALQKLRLDQLRMIPCHLPNHRQSASSESMHRLKMLQIATIEDAAIEIDPIEINRPGTSYTIDTLVQLQKKEIASSLVFVVGVDSFNTLPQWHRCLELFNFCHFLVLARSGASISTDVRELIDMESRLVESELEMFDSNSGKVYLANNFNHTISSTTVRSKLIAQEDVSAILDKKVIDYIRDNCLYRVS